MRFAFQLILAISLLLPAAGVWGEVPARVSPQGIFPAQDEGGGFLSPAGNYRMQLLPTGGDLHRIVADLKVFAADGSESILHNIAGCGFFVSDAGRIVVVTSDPARHVPGRIAVMDLAGNLLMHLDASGITDATLSSDGLQFACRTRTGTLMLDLEALSSWMSPKLSPFAAGPNGRLAGISLNNRHEIQLYTKEELTQVFAVERRPRKICFSQDGLKLFAIDGSELQCFDLQVGSQDRLYVAAAGEQLRDLKILENELQLGLRLRDGDRLTGLAIRFDTDGHLLSRQVGPTRTLPKRTAVNQENRGEADQRDTLPWPLDPNTQHPVGNTYGEFQNYGGGSYLHPGVDVMGDPGQPVFAVADGIVKAFLTTSGYYHWRVAVGQPGSGTSRGYLYAHLEESTVVVDVGDPVVAGQYLGDLVPWPSYEFTHCHFARIEDSGTEWYGDWLCVGNPHLDFVNQTETEAPVLETAVGNDLLAFCVNETSTYLNPEALQGAVDIIAHVGDRIESDWVCTVQELRYSIYPSGLPQQPLVDDKLAVFFGMDLDTYQNGPIDPFLVELLYKRDGTCWTRGDYDGREYFHILTNSDGNQIYEESDLWEAWDTTELPDRDYVIRVTAIDAAGNTTVDSMQVTTANGNPTWAGGPSGEGRSLALFPNPSRGGTTIAWAGPQREPVRVDLFDAAGRRLRNLASEAPAGGNQSFYFDGKDGAGRPLPSGIYLIRKSGKAGSETAKLHLLR